MLRRVVQGELVTPGRLERWNGIQRNNPTRPVDAYSLSGNVSRHNINPSMGSTIAGRKLKPGESCIAVRTLRSRDFDCFGLQSVVEER
jgi:hypothetical protein